MLTDSNMLRVDCV